MPLLHIDGVGFVEHMRAQGSLGQMSPLAAGVPDRHLEEEESVEQDMQLEVPLL